MKKLIIILALIGFNLNAQTNWCDSISYEVYHNPNLVFSVLGLTSDSLDNHADTVDFLWTVCNSNLCFSGNGLYASFPLILITDTVKVCYRAIASDVNWQIMFDCEVCNYVVHNGTEWVEMGNTVGLEEILSNGQKTNVTYDLKGRVVHDVKENTVYIKNMQKFIKLK